jgi:hypothetical protein
MKITHYICPRQSGKSEHAKSLQMEDPENTLLISAESKTDFGKALMVPKNECVNEEEYLTQFKGEFLK